MARGSVVWRCGRCRKNSKGKPSNCSHKGAGYYVVFREGGHQRWESAGINKKDAERKLAEILAEVNGGTYSKPSPIIFSEFAEKWLENYAVGAVSDSTLSAYRTMVRYRLIPAMGHSLMSRVTTERLQGFVSKTLTERSPKTVNNYIVLLKTIFKHAVDWGYIQRSPAQSIKRVRQEHREMDFLTPDEIPIFLKCSDEPYKTLFLTAIMTGMRRGEVLGLQWGDIDWNRNVIFVRRGLYWKSAKDVPGEDKDSKPRWRFVAPKSKRSIRDIVMSPRLKTALECHRIVCPASPFDLVFCNRTGQPMDPNNLVKREFFPALTRSGLRKIRFHDLRHTYTSLLISQGENVKFIQSQLGHASIQTTLDRYGHLLPNSQHGVGARIDEQLFGKGYQQKQEKSLLSP